MQGTDAGLSDHTDSVEPAPHALAEQRRGEALTRVEHPPKTGPVTTTPEAVLTGRWVQRRPRRYLGAAILGVALIGVVVGLELTVTVRTFEALAVLVAFTIIAVIAHTAFTVSAPTTVVLDGPRVEVRRGNLVDVFDLAGPIRRIVTVGRANRPNWRIRFETEDGRLVELGPAQVDPHVMTEVIARYRAAKPVPPRQRTPE